jgi:hypothetical protein
MSSVHATKQYHIVLWFCVLIIALVFEVRRSSALAQAPDDYRYLRPEIGKADEEREKLESNTRHEHRRASNTHSCDIRRAVISYRYQSCSAEGQCQSGDVVAEIVGENVLQFSGGARQGIQYVMGKTNDVSVDFQNAIEAIKRSDGGTAGNSPPNPKLTQRRALSTASFANDVLTLIFSLRTIDMTFASRYPEGILVILGVGVTKISFPTCHTCRVDQAGATHFEPASETTIRIRRAGNIAQQECKLERLQ